MDARKRRKTLASLEETAPNELQKILKRMPATKTQTSRQEFVDSPTKLHASRISGQKRSATSAHLQGVGPTKASEHPRTKRAPSLSEADLTSSLRQVSEVLQTLNVPSRRPSRPTSATSRAADSQAITGDIQSYGKLRKSGTVISIPPPDTPLSQVWELTSTPPSKMVSQQLPDSRQVGSLGNPSNQGNSSVVNPRTALPTPMAIRRSADHGNAAAEQSWNPNKGDSGVKATPLPTTLQGSMTRVREPITSMQDFLPQLSVEGLQEQTQISESTIQNPSGSHRNPLSNGKLEPRALQSRQREPPRIRPELQTLLREHAPQDLQIHLGGRRPKPRRGPSVEQLLEDLPSDAAESSEDESITLERIKTLNPSSPAATNGHLILALPENSLDEQREAFGPHDVVRALANGQYQLPQEPTPEISKLSGDHQKSPDEGKELSVPDNKQRSPRKAKTSKQQTMQAYQAKAVERLERQRDEKAAESEPIRRRLQARDSAAARELQQVRKKRDLAKKRLEAELAEAAKLQTVQERGGKEPAGLTEEVKEEQRRGGQSSKSSSRASSLISAARQLQGNMARSSSLRTLPAPKPPRGPVQVPTLPLAALVQPPAGPLLRPNSDREALSTRERPQQSSSAKPIAKELPRTVPSKGEAPDTKHEDNISRMLGRVSSLQQRIAALAHSDSGPTTQLTEALLASAELNRPTSSTQGMLGEQQVLTCRQFPRSYALNTARSFLDTPRLNSDASPEQMDPSHAGDSNFRDHGEQASTEELTAHFMVMPEVGPSMSAHRDSSNDLLRDAHKLDDPDTQAGNLPSESLPDSLGFCQRAALLPPGSEDFPAGIQHHNPVLGTQLPPQGFPLTAQLEDSVMTGAEEFFRDSPPESLSHGQALSGTSTTILNEDLLGKWDALQKDSPHQPAVSRAQPLGGRDLAPTIQPSTGGSDDRCQDADSLPEEQYVAKLVERIMQKAQESSSAVPPGCDQKDQRHPEDGCCEEAVPEEELQPSEKDCPRSRSGSVNEQAEKVASQTEASAFTIHHNALASEQSSRSSDEQGLPVPVSASASVDQGPPQEKQSSHPASPGASPHSPASPNVSQSQISSQSGPEIPASEDADALKLTGASHIPMGFVRQQVALLMARAVSRADEEAEGSDFQHGEVEGVMESPSHNGSEVSLATNPLEDIGADIYAETNQTASNQSDRGPAVVPFYLADFPPEQPAEDRTSQSNAEPGTSIQHSDVSENEDSPLPRESDDRSVVQSPQEAQQASSLPGVTNISKITPPASSYEGKTASHGAQSLPLGLEKEAYEASRIDSHAEEACCVDVDMLDRSWQHSDAQQMEPLSSKSAEAMQQTRHHELDSGSQEDEGATPEAGLALIETQDSPSIPAGSLRVQDSVLSASHLDLSQAALAEELTAVLSNDTDALLPRQNAINVHEDIARVGEKMTGMAATYQNRAPGNDQPESSAEREPLSDSQDSVIPQSNAAGSPDESPKPYRVLLTLTPSSDSHVAVQISAAPQQPAIESPISPPSQPLGLSSPREALGIIPETEAGDASPKAPDTISTKPASSHDGDIVPTREPGGLEPESATVNRELRATESFTQYFECENDDLEDVDLNTEEFFDPEQSDSSKDSEEKGTDPIQHSAKDPLINGPSTEFTTRLPPPPPSESHPESSMTLEPKSEDFAAKEPESENLVGGEVEEKDSKRHAALDLGKGGLEAMTSGDDESAESANREEIEPGKGAEYDVARKGKEGFSDVSSWPLPEEEGMVSAYWPEEDAVNKDGISPPTAIAAGQETVETLAEDLAECILQQELHTVAQELYLPEAEQRTSNHPDTPDPQSGAGEAGNEETEPTVPVRQDAAHINSYIAQVVDWYLDSYQDTSSEGQSTVGLKGFLEIERGYADVSDEQHIFNKALFDAANEAIRKLVPPYKSRLTAAQARMKRQVMGSEAWEAALHLEVTELVTSWSHPEEIDLDEEEAMRVMLIRDVHQDDFEDLCLRTRMLPGC